MAGMTRGFYNGKPQTQRDEAMRSVGMAATAVMWAATDLGYACSPMIGFDPDATGAAINLPEGHVVGMLIAVGKSNSAPYPKTEIDLAEILKYDFFPS
jgi:nitroreductase